MLKLSLRALAAHRLRLVLTIVAVILGTAFIAGASIFNSSLSATIESAVDKQMDGVDAFAMKSNDPLFSERDLARLAADDHIARVNIADQAGVVVAHPDLSALQTQGDTSQVIAYYPDEKIVGTPNTLMEGRPPQGTGEVIINSSAAEEYGIGVGDNLLVVHPQRRDTVTVVGLSQPPQELGDDVVLSMDAGGFQKLYGQPGALKLAGDNITDEQLVQHLREDYGWQAQTGREKGEDTAKVYKDNMRPVNYLLNAFGLISLLVGTFLIANTFAMIVSQRIKEFALVRALGASRRQVTGAVAAEAAVVGIAGSAVGVLVGIGLVSLIKAIMARQGMPFAGGHGITVVTVALPLVLGTVVTVVSAWVPARRAGSVHPIAAMRGTEDAAGSPLLVRSLVGAVLVVAGAACAVVAALFAHHMVLAAIGIISAIIGYFLAGPALSIPVMPAIGKVIGAPFGAVGRLAATNTRRNPRRAAATAFALTLGVALVSAIGMFGATLKAEAQDSVAHDIAADYLLTAPVGGEFSTPREAGELARTAEGVDSVTTLGMAAVTVGGEYSEKQGEYPVTMTMDTDPTRMLNLELVEGSTDSGEGFIAAASFAEDNGWKVGESYEVAGPGGTVPARLMGTFKEIEMVSTMVLSAQLAQQVCPEELQQVMMFGVRGENARAALEAAVKDLVVVQVVSAKEYGGAMAEILDQVLALLYALLALSVIIAVLGIINTLTLGISERRTEIGMLRAVGLQRRQIRGMIELESVQIALFGAVMGLGLGIGFGWAFLKSMGEDGFGAIQFPWGLVAIVLIGAAVVGAAAAVGPAVSAARTPMV